MTTRKPLRRALVSVYDKTGLVELGQELSDSGVEIVSTGSTAKTLSSAGISVTEVAELTGFPECLDGRVKTLHPKVHAGILADLRLESHRDQLKELEIEAFDLVITNLYPFVETVAAGASQDETIEQIDIGGPTMVRAAAKNHASVAVITSAQQYAQLREALAAGGFTLEQRRALAVEAFRHTASYDVAVATWLGEQESNEGFPHWYARVYRKGTDLRYGENAQQSAALYTDPQQAGLATAQQLHGKEMSYNNYVDADAAQRAAYDFDDPAVAIVKHTNPCAVAIGEDIAQAHRKAHAGDPVSAFGGVIACNRPVSEEMARQVAEIFTEVIVAPGYEQGAVDVLTKKKNIRILVSSPRQNQRIESRELSGGLLLQDSDAIAEPGDFPENWRLVAGDAVDSDTLADLAFAWRAVRSVKSNAIMLASDRASIGVGMGQVNRVDSCRLAVQRAGSRARGSVAASDAFFPFADGPQLLIDAGVKAIVQPGGSVRDEEVIAAATAAGIAMYFTGTRHFFH